MQFGKTVRFGDRPYINAVKQAKEEGFDFLDIGLKYNLPESMTAEQVAGLKEALSEFQMTAGFHAPWKGLQITSPRTELREASIALIKRCIDFASQFPDTYLVLHPEGQSELQQLPEVKAAMLAAGITAIKELAEYAKKKTVPLCVENIKSNFTELNEFSPLVKKTGASFCLDVGHAFFSNYKKQRSISNANDISQWINEFKNELAIVHFHDFTVSNGQFYDHLPIGDGILDLEVLTAISKKTKCRKIALEIGKKANGNEATNEEKVQGLKKIKNYLKTYR